MRITLLLSIIALMIVTLVVYLYYLEAGIYGHVINPLNAHLSVNNKTLIMAMTNILNLTMAGKYEEASLGIKLLNSTTAMSKIQSINQVLSAINNVNNELMMLNQYVVLARSLMQYGNYTGALEIAREGLNEVPTVYNDIISLTNTLSSISPSLASSYGNAFINELNEYRNAFLSILNTNLTMTMITLSVNSTEAYVGSQVMVSGWLGTINGSPIPNANITIMINNQAVSEAITNGTGYYTTVITIPHIYTNMAILTASYKPSLSSNYLPSSASVVITLLYNETTITVISNGTTYWGSPLTILGFASGPPNRVVSISLGNYSAITMTNTTGWFDTTINTTNLMPGNYTLTINVLPNATYSPATYTMNVSIVGLTRTLNVTLPGMLIAGIPTHLMISLEPLMNSTSVIIVVGNHIINEVMNSNSTLSLLMPITLSTGYYNVTIIIPQSPPFMETVGYARVFVINIIQVIIPVILAMIVIFLVRIRGFNVQLQEKAGSVLNIEKLKVESNLIRLTPPKRLGDPHVMDILRYTANAIVHISNVTGLGFNETYTFREYLARVGKALDNEKYTAFSELLLITETALYSRRLPTEDDVDRARKLTMVIANEG